MPTGLLPYMGYISMCRPQKLTGQSPNDSCYLGDRDPEMSVRTLLGYFFVNLAEKSQ